MLNIFRVDDLNDYLLASSDGCFLLTLLVLFFLL